MKKRGKFTIPTKYIIAILSFICIAFITLCVINENFSRPIKEAAATVIVPIQKGMNYVGGWFADKADTLKEINDLQEENERLKKENDELKSENVILSQQQNELERLRELYKLDDIYSDYPKVAARVIGKETSNWFTVFTIDKGSNDGLEVDMNVIADGGLVGRITYVGKNYAKVTSIINDGSNVSAKFATTSDICIVSGDLKLMNEGIIRVSNININANINEGDMLLTSYISDKYVPGILIGYVTGVEDDANRLTKSGYVMPVVDFAHLEEVLVITQLKEEID
ncbi:MAG: rod shape-determining protein MreC [Lachnospiraceae bacterium]|nr:rod shape-determining protein MreC [Lachnospiraceae bacterium]